MIGDFLVKEKSRIRAAAYCFVPLILSLYSEVALGDSDQFWAQKDNYVNLYMVKKGGWGWTLSVVMFYGMFALFTQDTVPWRGVARFLARLGVATLVWYCFTAAFRLIEEMTGSCHSLESQILNTELTTKRICYKSGHQWIGFDISGHAFLMIWNNLFISAEFDLLSLDPKLALKPKKKLMSKLLVDLLSVLIILWDFMLIFTSLYFHTILEKAIGSLIAIGVWYLLYENIYSYRPYQKKRFKSP